MIGSTVTFYGLGGLALPLPGCSVSPPMGRNSVPALPRLVQEEPFPQVVGAVSFTPHLMTGNATK